MFTRIHHVAIAVRSLSGALRFYRDVLGLTVYRVATVADQGVRAALLSVGVDEIELLEPLDPAGSVARFLERRGEGLHHLCVETPDIVAAVAEARAAGLPLIDQTPRVGLAGRIAFLHPKAGAGVLFEMAQPDEGTDDAAVSAAGLSPLGFETIYVVVTDLAGTVAAYVRKFGARPVAGAEQQRFRARAARVQIGGSSITFLSREPGVPVMAPRDFLEDRGEGLFGICLRVPDASDSLRRMREQGVPVETAQPGDAAPFAAIDPSRTHGVNLFLVSSGSDWH